MGTIVLADVTELTTVKISELPEASSLGKTDILPVVKGTITQKISKDAFAKDLPLNIDHTIYVAKSGSDSNTGSIGDPFLTIGAANNYAISLLNPVTDWNECAVVKVAPGKYTEHLTSAHRRVYIIGNLIDFEGWPKDVIIYNTGADAAHYPIDTSEWLNLIGIQVEVDADVGGGIGGVYGRLINKGIYSLCSFNNGYFINNPDVGYMTSYFNFCYFNGDGFKLAGSNNGAFLAFRRCDLDCTNTEFSTTSISANVVKFHSSMCSSNMTIGGNWSLLMQNTELYADGKITFNTDGFIDMYNSVVVNGLHFVKDTALHKKITTNYFKDITLAQDIIADVVITDVDFLGNKTDKGICGNIQTQMTEKNVGEGSPDRYYSLQAAISSIPTGGVGTIQVFSNLADLAKLTLPCANVSVTIDGQKQYSLTFTGDIIEVGANQKVSFTHMSQLTGGDAILNGASAEIGFESCQYINGSLILTLGAFAIIYKSSMFGATAKKAIHVNNTGTTIVVGYSKVQGSTGNPAVEFNAVANNKLKAKFSTFIHGDKTTTAPIQTTVGSVIVSIYNCAGNANLTPPATISNDIGSPGNVYDSEINF